MVDIFLDLDDALIAKLEGEAKLAGCDLSTFLRDMIEANVPREVASSYRVSGDLNDEPIVKAAEIENECRRLGYLRGWRFMMCPQANMRSAKLLVVTLNPGGNDIQGTTWSHEAGNAYCVESWGDIEAGKAALQVQMQAMYRLLGVCDDEVFTANYVPFRSPTWQKLSRRAEAMAFAGKLWRWLRPQLHFELAVCVGKDEPGRSLAALFDATLEATIMIGWGTVTADRYRLPDGRMLVALPHLSRFSVFGRGASEDALRELFQL